MVKGVFYSLFASILFSLIYYLAVFLRPLSGESLFGFRMWVMYPFLILALFIFKQQHHFLAFIKNVLNQPKLILILLLNAMLAGSQMWLFLWAPNHGAAIDVSIGYLLMPIVMVAFGKIIFKEQLSKIKLISILFALLGVLSSLITTGTLSWATMMVCIGYPIYFSLRKYFNIAHISSFAIEIALLLPISAYFISQTDLDFILSQNQNLYFFLMALGILSGMALISYTIASSLVPMNVLGLLGYVEPAAMLVVSFIIGETLSPNAYILMCCLISAILLLLADGLISIKKQRKIK